MKRPKIPNKKTLLAFSKADVTKNAAVARRWYAEEGRILAIQKMATVTFSFLVDNEHTVKDDGDLDTAEPWWPRNYNPKETCPAAIDHRGVRMRQRALSFGLAHFLRALTDAALLPEGTAAHIDDVTNLASLRLHDRMMEDDFESRVSSINLEELKFAYLYAKTNTSDILYGRIAKMELIGLWFAEAPLRDGLSWQIRIGPVAKIFHLDAFYPAISVLQKKPALQMPNTDPSDPRSG